jgi:hypothetical protein
MLPSLRFRVLLPCALLAVTSVVCGGNAPLPIGNTTTTGAAGTQPTLGAGGQGGSTSSTGIGGSSPAGDASGFAGTFGGPAGTIGTGGVVGTGGTVGPTGEAGSSGGIAMCGAPTRADGLCVMGAFKRSGVCTCQAGAPCVCPGVGCIDPLTDPDNCGTCGVHCGPTSTCNDGVCGPAPVPVMTVMGCSSLDLAIGGGMLYWTDAAHATVSRMSLSGGSFQPLGSAEKPSKIVVAGTTAVWLYANASIRVSHDGGPAEFILSGGAQIGGLALTPDASTLYFSSGNDVSRMPVAGGTPVVVAHEVKGGLPGSIALVGSNAIAFPTALNGDVEVATLIPGQVVSCGLEDPATGELLPNTNCQRLARSQGELFADTILAVPSLVVWADGPNLKMESPLGNGTFDSAAMSDNSLITGLAMTPAMAYFSDTEPMTPGTGVVYKTPLVPNSIPIHIARGQNGPRSVVVGDKKVYWSTADCTIMSQNL